MKIFIIIMLMLLGGPVMAKDMNSDYKIAVFAGGCFWCLVPPFDKVQGVLDTEAGYIGGHVANPTYEQVSTGKTGHREAIAIKYNPDEVSYSELLDVFFYNTDPFDPKGQFVDKGEQYTTAIYYSDASEQAGANAVIKAIEDKSGKKVATVIVPMATFYPAEEYHQDYYKKNPLKYKMYKLGSGR